MVLEDSKKGDVIHTPKGDITLLEDVEFAHKVASSRLKKDKKGLFLMNYESHDGEVVTGEIGCGAQIVVFTTGRGNPTGHPLAPVIKVTGNYKTYAGMAENFDFDASGVISANDTIEEDGKKLFDYVMDVANGKVQTSAEKFGGTELFCIARCPGYHRPADCEQAFGPGER